MIYISNALYLAAAAAAVQDGDLPLIGWRSILTPSNFSSDDGENAGVMWSPATYSYWESDPKSSSEDDIEFIVALDNPDAEAVDYLGFVAHNLYTLGATFKLQHSFDGSVWVDTFSATSAVDDSTVFYHFDSVTAQFFRLVITAPAGEDLQVRIAHLRLGRALRLQRKMYVGISPFRHNKRVEKIVTVSDSGKYLGSVAKSTVNLYTINQPDNSAAFIRSEVTPFLDHVELIGSSEETNGPPGTFFAAWRPQEYPNEVLYCHPPEQIQRPVNQRPNGMVQWQISGEAEA